MAGKQNLRQGFTMIEIMLVLLIMVSIAALGVVTFNGVQNTAKIQMAEAKVQDIAKAVELFNVTIGRYPSTDEGIDALLSCPSSISNPDKWTQLIKTIPVDPWDNPFQYQYPSSHDSNGFDIWSCGPDGISGTDDDITNWGK